jgi:hypothetical protein
MENGGGFMKQKWWDLKAAVLAGWAKLKARLVDDWQIAWKFASVQWSAFLIVLFAAIPELAEHWPDLAPGFVTLFPTHGAQLVPIVSLVLSIALRLIKQRKLGGAA